MRYLQQLRKNAGKTQREVAAYLDVERSTYAKYESGSSEPTFDALTKLAVYFGVTTDYLLSHDEGFNLSELSEVYINFAKRAQNSRLDPDDIELILATAEFLKDKKRSKQF